MGELRLVELGKVYDEAVAVEDLSLTVRDGEFLTLLGPSGCGKTTTLRMIAGFVRPSTGKILLAEKVISSAEPRVFVPPERRSMGMVFQSYAVWPHMDVFQNVAYPLKFKKLDKASVRAKVERALSLVKLEGLSGRYPHQLSGGQQQRVALGRALVMEPEVLLLDEPLSNLDAKLRDQMRGEIRQLQQRVRVTIVYVTHDQSEAITMSDRIAVMNQGRVLQIGSPREIYDRPADRFVAGFVGTANFIDARVVRREDGQVVFQLENSSQSFTYRPEQPVKKELVTLVVRPENMHLCPPDKASLKGTVKQRIYRGDRLDYLILLGELPVKVEATTSDLYDNNEEVGMNMNNFAVLPRA